jgi:hypothetical protein
MKLQGTKVFPSIFFLVSIYSASAYAADLLGNPTVIGAPGKFELQIGGGKSSDLAMDLKKSVSYIQIGTLASGTQSIPEASGTLKEDQVFIGASYTLNEMHKAKYSPTLAMGKAAARNPIAAVSASKLPQKFNQLKSKWDYCCEHNK